MLPANVARPSSFTTCADLLNRSLSRLCYFTAMRFSMLVITSSILSTGPRCLVVDLSWPFNLSFSLHRNPLCKSPAASGISYEPHTVSRCGVVRRWRGPLFPSTSTNPVCRLVPLVGCNNACSTAPWPVQHGCPEPYRRVSLLSFLPCFRRSIFSALSVRPDSGLVCRAAGLRARVEKRRAGLPPSSFRPSVTYQEALRAKT